ncbi:MAG TPA: O-acetyl-ADP-ribose deacetylase [Anaeromyxobacteraceae bacterium]|nr:O-acetyl-ADP-ribose deacetylase [Anaeromyxobacteraceae bacterium]
MESSVFDRIDILMADITQLEVDAIVNAANPTLLGGEGVDGMIHWAGGEQLTEACRALGGCPTGEARLTAGFNLPARHVIHAVGPVYRIDGVRAPELLASCYRWSLRLAVENGARTIAFPAISCGVYGYPVEEACRVALDTTCAFLESNEALQKVIFALFSQKNRSAYLEYFVEKFGREPS